jgi:hypothetical protein
MKKLTVVLIALSSMLIVPAAIAQTYTGNLYLLSQADVNGFSYSEVTGSLTISGTDILDLSPLSGLTRVGAYIAIIDNTVLVDVDGFQNLTDVGSGIYVYDNTNLVSFSGFDALLQTGDNIDFWYNDSLVTVAGFSSLHTAGWSLEFGGNAVLTSIPDFKSLQTINSSLFILDNVSLPSITGFKALQNVDWSFDIPGNTSLTNLCGFYDYFSASESYTGGGSFDISENHPSLPSPMTMQDILDAGPCAIPLLDSLILDIQAMGLSKGTKNFLVRPLAKAKNFLESDRESDAIKTNEGLIDDIRSRERRGKIESETADYIVADILEIIDAISS